MKISVVIPVYNVENYLRECIESVLNQTLKDFELIAVDDGSTDSSGSILDEYQQKDTRITVIHKQNGGVSAARNDALEKCTGEYIYIMDSDDYLELDALENMYEAAIASKADVVITDHCKFIDPEEQRQCHFFPKEFVATDRDIILQLQRMVLHKAYSPYPTEETYGVGIGAPWTKLIKKKLIVENNLRFEPYVRGVFDDCLFTLNVFEHAEKVAYKNVITYHFRVLQSSLTHRYRTNQLEIYERIYEKIEEFGDVYNKGEEFQKAYYARVITYLWTSFNTYFFNEKYQGSKKQNYKEFMATIKSKRYHEAIANVDINKLIKREKRIVLLSRMNFNRTIWLAYTLKKMKK